MWNDRHMAIASLYMIVKRGYGTQAKCRLMETGYLVELMLDGRCL